MFSTINILRLCYYAENADPCWIKPKTKYLYFLLESGKKESVALEKKVIKSTSFTLNILVQGRSQ
jgi:hypothetical protein